MLRLPDDLSEDSLATYSSQQATAARTSPPTLSQWTLATEAAPGAAGAPPPRAAGQYQLLGVIGQGGMGEVFEAVQTSLGRIVAVKRIRRTGDEEPRALANAVAAFHTEAMMAAHLEHPNIVPVHDLGMDADGMPLLAMKLVEGDPWSRSLRDDIDRIGVGDFLGKHLPILASMAQAVAFAHSRGIVHRDLKPAQVMLGQYGEVLLTDWGLAVQVAADGAEASHKSLPTLPTRAEASSPSGTPALMAPEQTEDSAERVGTWTDVYLLGGTLYFLLTGSYPHQDKSASASMRRAAAGIVEPPRERAPGRDIPAELESLAMRCLAREPKERLASAKAFVGALQDYLSGAGKRRESADLAAKAWTALAVARGNYAVLADCLGQLQRALTLWPENGEAKRAQAEAQAAYADAAIANGDLVLARLHAEQLAEGDRRAALLRSVADGFARQESARRQRRLLAAGVMVLLVAIVAGTLVFSRKLADERDEAREARRIAEEQGRVALERARGAQSLVEFMLVDLGKVLQPDTPRDQGLIRAVTGKVVDYYHKLDTSKDSAPTRLEHARGAVTVANSLKELGEVAAAEELGREALSIREALAAGDAAAVGEATQLLGVILRDTGKAQEAETALKRSLELAAKSPGKGTPGYASALDDYAQLLFAQGKFKESEALQREALAIREERLGPNSGITGESLSNLGLMLCITGRKDEGLPMMRRGLEAMAADFGEASASFTGSASSYATFLEDEAEAAVWQRRAIAGAEKFYGPDSPRLAALYTNLASSFPDTDPRGDELLLKAIGITERAYGIEHFSLLPQLTNLAFRCNKTARTAEAVAASRRAMAIAKQNKGNRMTPKVARNAAIVLGDAGEWKEAEEAARLGLETLVGIGDADVVAMNCHRELARALAGQDRHAERLEAAATAARMARKIFGEEDARNCDRLSDWLMASGRLGKHADARLLARRLLAIRLAKTPDAQTGVFLAARQYATMSRQAAATGDKSLFAEVAILQRHLAEGIYVGDATDKILAASFGTGREIPALAIDISPPNPALAKAALIRSAAVAGAAEALGMPIDAENIRTVVLEMAAAEGVAAEAAAAREAARADAAKLPRNADGKAAAPDVLAILRRVAPIDFEGAFPAIADWSLDALKLDLATTRAEVEPLFAGQPQP